MRKYQELLNQLFKVMDGFRPQDPQLYEHLSEVMEGQYYPEDQVLYTKDMVIDKAYYLASGTMATYIYHDSGDKQLLTIYRAGEIIAGKSFMDQTGSDYYLTVCKDSYLLSVTHEQMKIVYERFPDTEELARIILAARERKELLRNQMLILPAVKLVEEFYLAYPELTIPGKILVDADIASYLMISESSLRSNRAKIFRD